MTEKTSLTVLRPAATKTAFCLAEIPLGDGRAFYVDGNSKITAGNGSFTDPKPNAFSLPAASVSGEGHCPGSTEGCRASCYVRGLAKHAPELYGTYEANAAALRECFGKTGLAYSAAGVLARWIRGEARGGFRWHVSGDVWHAAHAHWIVNVCRTAPEVDFWIYTRTLGAVSILSLAPNLAVNVSADADNYTEAREVAAKHGARICYLTSDGTLPEDLALGSVIFPDYALRGRDLPEPTDAPWWRSLTHEQRRMVCPTDFFSQSESMRCGPCDRCLVLR